MKLHKEIVYLLIIVTVALLYGRTAWYDYALDDKIMITENANVQKGIKAIPDIFSHTTFYGFKNYEYKTDKVYRPLPLSLYALEISCWGMNPGVHHILNVAWYALLCCVLYLLLSKYWFSGHSKWVAAGMIFLYLIHPVHSEVVCNIKSRDEILCFAMFALSLLFLMYACNAPTNRRNALCLWTGAVFYLFSLLSKETAVSFILIFPLVLLFFTGVSLKNDTRVLFKMLSPFVLVLIFYLIVRQWVISSIPENNLSEVTLLNNALLEFNNPGRIIMAFYILMLYLKLLIFPFPLVWDYSLGYFHYGTIEILIGVLSIILHLILLIIAFKGYKNKPVLSFCILFYFISISLVSNILVPISSTMGERFLFTPSLAFCIAFILLIDYLLTNERYTQGIRKGAVIILLIIGGFYVYGTADRVTDWKDERTLIRHDHRYTHSLRSHITFLETLAEELDEKPGDLVITEIIRKELPSIMNDYPEKQEKSTLWHVAGNALVKVHKQAEAIQHYQKALLLQPSNTDARFNMATVYHIKGDLEKAKDQYLYILETADTRTSAYVLSAGNLGMVHHATGNIPAAKKYYEEAIMLGTRDRKVVDNYRLLIKEMGRK